VWRARCREDTVSGRHDTTTAPGQGNGTGTEYDRRLGDRFGYPLLRTSEAATILSVPTFLLFVNFVVQPALEMWPKLGYVRYPAARTAPPHRIAPEPFTDVAWWWHEITRLTHAGIHDPSGLHGHVLGNAALIAATSVILLALLGALGERRWFSYVYWELVVVAPIVGSYAFDLFGRTAHGYGASTVGFAFMGVLFALGLTLVGTHVRTGRIDATTHLLPVVAVLAAVGLIVGADFVANSPAMPVHQAGFGFGALVGAVAIPLVRRR